MQLLLDMFRRVVVCLIWNFSLVSKIKYYLKILKSRALFFITFKCTPRWLEHRKFYWHFTPLQFRWWRDSKKSSFVGGGGWTHEDSSTGRKKRMLKWSKKKSCWESSRTMSNFRLFVFISQLQELRSPPYHNNFCRLFSSFILPILHILGRCLCLTTSSCKAELNQQIQNILHFYTVFDTVQLLSQFHFSLSRHEILSFYVASKTHWTHCARGFRHVFTLSTSRLCIFEPCRRKYQTGGLFFLEKSSA